MTTSRPVLLFAALMSFALIGVALFLQHTHNMLPCPLCIIQRYAFAAVGIICLIFAFMPRGATRPGALLGALAALCGAGVAGWHLWVKAHPDVSCGIDPLETSLNRIPTAELLPFVFKADGLCSTEYEPILGLSIPQWSLFWFAVFSILLIWAALRQSR
ncbi:MAG: disulfide bond formation protein [Noviherbaspirillum sp.]|jgi:disulfide bond formation protein DsbB|nr:disulfide bond formation protein [Noviherbaspirillum sp.]